METGNFPVCEKFTVIELHIYEIPEEGSTELCIKIYLLPGNNTRPHLD
jgi:hypothetical protein